MASTTTFHSCGTIFKLPILLIFIVSSLSFEHCDARDLFHKLNIIRRITLQDYNSEIDSLDLPTMEDAYYNDPHFPNVASPPLYHNYPSLIAPSPSLITSPNPNPSPSPSPSPSPTTYNPIPIPPPQHGPTLRPVGSPTHNPGPSPSVWCVARPTVPDPLIQRAMDYACGAGAECGSVKPNGPCFEPNTLVAHASYAFNSYWQRTKIVGGTCDFGGTAMLITVDPSYEGCHFVYN